MKATFTKLALGMSLALSSLAQAELALIPKPKSVTEHQGKTLTLSNNFKVSTPKEFEPSIKAGLENIQYTISSDNADITVKKDDSIKNKEGYTLKVGPKNIIITAKSSSGAYYATQTLKQLMPVGVWKKNHGLKEFKLPQVDIVDEPRFGWRGIMLDSSRHFQTIEEIRRFIDRLAYHKLNVFHWHLTDGHGWRFESKKYPNLHKRGSWRIQPGYPAKGKKEKYGGYYTQKEMKEMVEYARVRGVTIVPEIDMPGHCFAWVAAYPSCGCLDKEQTLDFLHEYPTKAQRFPGKPGTDVLCVGKDEVVKMCKDIIDEMMEIFPSKFVHIGGDEVAKHWWKKCAHCQKRRKEEGLKDEHELQSWFIQQLDNHITSKGRRLIGWDEILEGGLAKNATVMSWTGEKGGIKAAKMGHDVVMSPQTYIYLDHGQSHSPIEPPHWPGHKPLDRAYNYDPVPPQLKPEEGKHILGIQGNVWTIFTHEEWLIDICTWPRAAAIAETGWTPKADKSWDSFYKRLSGTHRARLDVMGINYWWETSAELGAWTPADLKPKEERVVLSFDITGKLKPGNHDISFNYTGGPMGLSIETASILLNGKEVSKDEHVGFTGGKQEKNVYKLSIPATKAGDTLTLKCKVYGNGGQASNGKISVSSVETKILKYLPWQDEYKLGEDNLIDRKNFSGY